MLKVDLRPAHMTVGTRRIHYGWIIVVLAGFDVDDQRIHPLLRLRPGAPLARSRRHGVELRRRRVCLQPSMVPVRVRRSGRWLGLRPLRRPPHHVPGSVALHRRHDADRHHDPTVAVLPLLRHHPGHRNVHLPSASRIRDERVVQDSLGLGDGRPPVHPELWHSDVHSVDGVPFRQLRAYGYLLGPGELSAEWSSFY